MLLGLEPKKRGKTRAWRKFTRDKMGIRGLFHGNTKLLLSFLRGTGQISLSSVHEKVVSTWEYLTHAQALLWELIHQCDYGCNTWIYISLFMQFLLMSKG